MFLISSTLSLLSPLLSTAFWSRLGFLISYFATSFLVLEVLRLIYTDDKKRDVEKFLDNYSKTRTPSPPRRTQQEVKKVSLEELDKAFAAPETAPAPTGSPQSEKTLVEGERRRRSPSHEHPATATAAHAMTTSPSPRRLRKRSDTLNSTSSSESRNPFRRRREASPASEVGSKASSRQGSPLRRTRKEEKSGAERSTGLRGLVRAKV